MYLVYALSRYVILLACWAVMAWSAYSIYHQVQNNKLYDPFEVLGVSPGANEKTIKRAYKVMSLKWHPDKAKDEKTKAVNNLKFVDINKAYKTLTDEVSRKNWEEYGNPDGPTTYSLGIALPSWLIDSKNSFWVLALYALGFGILVPFLVSRSWNSSTKYTKDGTLQSTMALFYRELKQRMNMKEIAELIGQAEEFDSAHFKWATQDTEALFNFVKSTNDKFDLSATKSRKLTEPATRVACLLFCQFHRIELPEATWRSDQVLVVSKAVHLASGVLKIALVRDWPVTCLNAITLNQFMVQAVWENHLPILQLPHFTAETSLAYLEKAKKPTIRDLLSFSDETRRSVLEPLNLSESQLDDVMRVARSFPDCNILNVDFKILGQEEITPEGVITCLVKLKLNRLEDAMKLDLKKESEKAKNEKVEIEQFNFDEDGNMVESTKSSSSSSSSASTCTDVSLQPVHAPYYALPRKPFWWLFLLSPDLQTLICPPLLIKDLEDEKTVTMQFPAPPRPGIVNFRLMLRSDCLYGADSMIETKFVIHKEAKKIVESDWDISDNESEEESPFGHE